MGHVSGPTVLDSTDTAARSWNGTPAADVAPSAGHRVRDWIPLLLVVLSLAYYLPGINWGLPSFTSRDRMHSWGNDDLVPLAPLAEMYNTFVEEEPNRNVAYPWFHYALVAAAYAPYLAYVAASGRLQQPTSGYPFGLEQPEAVFRTLTWIGRSVSLALAVVLVLAMYFAGKFLWGRRAGVLTAVLTLLLYPVLYYAKLGNLDVPVLAWTALGLATCALCLRQGATLRRGALLGAFIALAVATKDQAAASFLFVLPALLLVHIVSVRRRELAPDGLWRPLVGFAAGFVGVYLIASGMLFDPSRFVRHATLVFSTGTGTVNLYNRYPATLAGYAAHCAALFRFLTEVLSWPVLLLSGCGLLLALRTDRRALVLVLASIGFFAILVPVRFGRIHYLLPVALPLTLFAAYAADWAFERKGVVRLGLLGALGVGMSLLFLQGVDLSHAMVRDSRYAAADWLDSHARPGDQLLDFGAVFRLPRVRSDVVTTSIDWRANARPAIAAGSAEFIIVMPDDTNEQRRRVEWRHGRYSVHNDYMRPEDFDALVDGTLGYRLVAKFQSPRLLPWLPRPFLSYSTVNPPIQIFARGDRAAGMSPVEPWLTAPHYPKPRRSYEPMIPAPVEEAL